jgi:predicted RNA polymerase sigma factor
MTVWPRYLATAWREEGRLAERLGRVAEARTAYARYLALRDAPEDTVRPAVEEVRHLLERLEPSVVR